MFVIGRGVEFATAREIALKLLETCRVAAEPLTATDLAHGPVAALDPLFPVWAIASDDGTLAPVQEAAARIREMGATLVASGTAARPDRRRAYRVPVPTPSAALLSPLLSVIPGQLFAVGARPRPRPRRRRAARPRQGHARPLGRAHRPRGAGACARRTRSRNDSTGNPGPGSQWSLFRYALLTSAWPVIPRRPARRSSASSQRTGIRRRRAHVRRRAPTHAAGRRSSRRRSHSSAVWRAKPASSTPTEAVFPPRACQATSFSRTHWITVAASTQ